jgi:branched-chain amino acid transport system ATP-binding protein
MILEIKDIDVYYGAVQALHDVSLHVGEGEIVTLIGANGAGKSTTLRTVSGLIRPRKGQIIFKGQDITRVPPHRIAATGVSHVLEGRQIFPTLTVLENLDLGAYTRSDKKGVAEAMDRVFALFPRLKERTGQMGGTLSGGEQQMLSIGRAMMTDPDILLLDEPSLGLAPTLVEQIFETIKEINEAGTSIFLVEQNAVMAFSVADRGYVLETGSILLEGTVAELRENPQVQAAYMGEA